MSSLLKKAAAVVLGTVLSLLMIVAAERSVAWWTGFQPIESRFYAASDAPFGLGWVSPKNTTVTHEKSLANETIFDTSYQIDGLHRRVTPSAERASAAGRFMLFFGGSNIFGEGLADDQTIPELVQQEFEDTHQVYNYGGRGYGTQQMLLRLLSGSMPGQIAQETGIVFYSYHWYHVHRVIGSLRVVKWAGGRPPYFYLDGDDQLQHAGSFAEGRPALTRLYWQLSKSAIVNHFGVDIPATLSSRHYELTCRIIEQSRRLATDQFPTSSFVVLLAQPEHNDAKRDGVVECLDDIGIASYDVSIPSSIRQGMVFRGDGHLNEDGARYIADKVVEFVATR